MSSFIDISGHKYGRLRVIKRDKNRKGRTAWLCKCDCGTFVTVLRQSLRSGATVSCGCYMREVTIKAHKKHGHSPSSGKSPEYSAWVSMIQRCNNPNSRAYKDYGARGIIVCDEWMSFDNFLRDMGCRPDSMTLDRIDNNGNYEPSNCRWATRKQQMRNRRNNRILEYNGKKLTLTEWSEETGLTIETIRNRLRLGWDLSHALTVPSDDKKLSVARNGRKLLMMEENQ